MIDSVQVPKKNRIISIRFNEPQKKELEAIAKQSGLPEAEIVRLCFTRQLRQIRKDGGINLKIDLDKKD